MIDELTLYNLEVKYHNLKDIANAIEEMVRAEVIEEFVTDYINEDINYCDDCKRGEEEYCCIKCFKDWWLKEQNK